YLKASLCTQHVIVKTSYISRHRRKYHEYKARLGTATRLLHPNNYSNFETQKWTLGV
ncbi:unnamed protein product, partial [Musa acuminata subsp. burmannicoides]